MFTYPTPMQNSLFLEECLATVSKSPSFPTNPSEIRKMLLLPSAGLSKYRDFRGDNTSLQPITGLALWNNNMIIQIFYQMNNRCNIHVYYKHTYIKRKFYGYLMCKLNCYTLGYMCNEHYMHKYMYMTMVTCIFNMSENWAFILVQPSLNKPRYISWPH